MHKAIKLLILGGAIGFANLSLAGVPRDLAYSATTSDPNEIARQVYYVNHFYAFSDFSVEKHPKGTAIVINVAPDKPNRVMLIERHINNTFKDGIVKSKEIAIIRDGDNKSTGMLIIDYEDDARQHDHFVWLPELRKVRRFSQPAYAEAWAGTHFTYGDLTLRKPEYETHALLGVERFNQCLGSLSPDKIKNKSVTKQLPAAACEAKGKQVYRLKSATKFTDWWYDYRISLVDTKTYADYQTEYYKDGKLIKTIDRDWRSMGMKDPRAQYWTYWYTRDLRDEHESEIIVPRMAMKYNHDKDDGFWSLKTLRQLNR